MPDDTATEERVNYRELIRGEPGAKTAKFFKLLAAVEAVISVLATLFLFDSAMIVVIGVVVGGATMAAFCYSLAIIIENAIAIRVELEFQNEAIEKT